MTTPSGVPNLRRPSKSTLTATRYDLNPATRPSQLLSPPNSVKYMDSCVFARGSGSDIRRICMFGFPMKTLTHSPQSMRSNSSYGSVTAKRHPDGSGSAMRRIAEMNLGFGLDAFTTPAGQERTLAQARPLPLKGTVTSAALPRTRWRPVVRVTCQSTPAAAASVGRYAGWRTGVVYSVPRAPCPRSLWPFSAI